MSSSVSALSLADKDAVNNHVHIQVTDKNGDRLYEHQISTSLSRSEPSDVRKWCWESLPLRVIFERVLQIKDRWLCEDLHLVIQDHSFDYSYGPISLFGPTCYGSLPECRDEMRLHKVVDRALTPDNEINDGFILTMTAVRRVRGACA